MAHLRPTPCAFSTHTQMYTHLSLEGAIERCEEVWARGESQDPPLHQGALCVFVLEENVFLQHLHRKQTLAASLLRKQHLCSNTERWDEAAVIRILKGATVCLSTAAIHK